MATVTGTGRNINNKIHTPISLAARVVREGNWRI